jgi:hypothetical protein
MFDFSYIIASIQRLVRALRSQREIGPFPRGSEIQWLECEYAFEIDWFLADEEILSQLRVVEDFVKNQVEAGK